MSASAGTIAKEIAGQCLGLRARTLGRAVGRVYDQALRRHGITGAQLSMLVVVQRFGEVSQTEVGRRLDLEKSTLSRNVRLLLDAGLIGQVSSGSTRAKLLSLTSAGSKLLVQAYPDWKHAQDQVASQLGESQVKLLTGASAPK